LLICTALMKTLSLALPMGHWELIWQNMNCLIVINTKKAEQGYEPGKEGIVSVEIADKVKVGGEAYIGIRGGISLEQKI